MHIASLLFQQQCALERAATALSNRHRDTLPTLLRLVRDALAHLRIEEALTRVVAERTTEIWVAQDDDAAEHIRSALCDLAHTPAGTAEFVQTANALRIALDRQIAYENEELVPCMLRCCTTSEMMRMGAEHATRGHGGDLSAA